MTPSIDAGKLRERLEVMELKEGPNGVWTWESVRKARGQVELNTVKKNLFSSVGIGARGAELVLRRQPLTLHQAILWGERHLFLTAVLPEGRLHLRVQAALACGADLVFALPAPCACAGAEAFARAGVRILAAAGCDALVFGAETPDTALLQKAARVLCSEAYRTTLKQQLAAGARSFAAARQAAVQALCPGADIAALLDKSNNNLAVEYCKAIIELNVEMQPIALPRQGADHGQALTESAHAAFASASALRALWAEGGAAAMAPYVPQKALKLYKQAEYDGKYTDFAVMGHCELALLRAACTEQAPFAAVRGVSEGLEHRLENAVRETASLPALLDALTTVRYPRARMRRLAMDAALGYTAQTPALPPYLHLLGARKEALPLPGETALPLSHSLARLARENETCAQMAAAQSRASDLGALCRAKPEPMGGIYRQKIIFLTN